tara:strand:+ start:1160 stop:1336 length:177 start_codon:yes stop_codon:yes gene_type:complete
MVSKSNRGKKGGNMFVDIGVPAVLLGALQFMKSRSKKYQKNNKTKKVKKNKKVKRNKK